MADRLSIELQADLQHVRWYLIGDRVTEGQCHIDELAEQLPKAGLPTLVLWPMEQASVHQVTIPPGQQRNLARILPFAIEEYLAQDIDQVHLVPLAGKPDSGLLPVAVVDKSRLQAVLTQLDEQKITLRRVELLSEAYKRHTNIPALLLAQDDAIWLAQMSFRGLPELAIQQALATNDQAVHLVVDDETLALEVESEFAAAEQPIERAPDSFDDLHKLAVTTAVAPSTVGNFLQGEFARQSQSPLQGLPWKPFVGAAALLFAVSTTHLVIEAVTASRQAAAYDIAIESTFTQAMGDEVRFRPQRWRQQIEQVLSAQGEGDASGFIPISRAVSKVYSQVPGLTLSRLRYADTRDQLSFVVEGSNLAQIEAFEQALKSESLSVERTIEQRQGRSVGSFTITGAAGR
ncbi:type II secretion system protein GspL [Salinibius halmophilus]|uniref:type II secretion system protein GspL n=1 Tax=Salinibius halmophilus TaxID=1853216 RepID=UPI000E6722FA|nr:type II secretion system protein GspL [Salinibius halmophilus]